MGTVSHVMSVPGITLGSVILSDIDYGENAVVNSQATVWSNADTAKLTDSTERLANGMFTANTDGWTPVNCTIESVAGGYDGNCCRLTRTGGDTQHFYQDFTVVPGVYTQFGIMVREGTSGAEAFKITIFDANLNELHYVTGTAESGAWPSTTTKCYFTSPTATVRAQIEKSTATAGTMLFDYGSCKAKMQQITTDDALAHDGWVKGPVNGSNTPSVCQDIVDIPSNATYATRIIYNAGAAGLSLSNRNATDMRWYRQYLGSTVVFGAMVKGVAGHVRLFILDGSTYSYSPYVSGAVYEILYVSAIVPTSATTLMYGLATDIGYDGYIVNPMFRRGNILTATDYATQKNEILYLEKPVVLLSNASLPNGTSYINIPTWPEGKLPSGLKGIAGTIYGTNTAANKSLAMYDAHNGALYAQLYSQVANVPTTSRFEGSPLYNGQKIHFTAADANWSGVYVSVNKVIL